MIGNIVPRGLGTNEYMAFWFNARIIIKRSERKAQPIGVCVKLRHKISAADGTEGTALTGRGLISRQ